MPLDDQQELFFWVDEQDNVLGTVTRGQAHHDPNKIHRAVQIVLVNSQGLVLLQKRSKTKDKEPGLWTVSASGHVTYPATYDETAKRELQEELGVTTPLTFHSKMIMNGATEREYEALYLGHYEDLPLNFDCDEVEDVKWVTKKELETMRNKLTRMGLRTLTALGYLSTEGEN